MSTKVKVLILVTVAALCFWAGWMMNPQEVRIETIEVEREVIKEVKDVRTVRETTQRPDGTVVIKETTEDKSVTDTSKESESKSLQVTKRSLPQWRVRVTRELDFAREGNPEYGVGIEKRFIGPVSLGAWATTDKQVGVSISYEF